MGFRESIRGWHAGRGDGGRASAITAAGALVAGMGLVLGLCASISAQTTTSSSQEPLACLKCHASIEAALQRRFKHAAVEMGCESCHGDHRRAGYSKQKEEAAGYLNARQPDLCLSCHDASAASLQGAHKAQPFERSTCTACHDPHASDSPKLLPAVSHAPFQAGTCDGCHRAPEGGVRMAATTVREMCFGCHQDLKQRLEAAASKHTLVSADASSCSGCHDPHVASRPHLLRKKVNELCADCHGGITAGKKFVHAPAAASCTSCHDAHASDYTANLHAPMNELCLECHGENAVRLMQQTGPMSLFGGRATLPAGTFGQLKFLRLSRGGSRGHPTADHPVWGAAQDGKSQINCVTCHQPHATEASPQLYVTGSLGSTALCVKCHR